jgi:TRAP-type C4-dicarboxylate transport system permease small subunit
MGENALTNVYDGLLKIIKFLVVVLSIALVVIVFANVISRYFLNFALAWSDEAARFLFIWVSFLGAVLANAKNEHMKLDILVQKVPEKVGKVILLISNIIILIILGVLFKGGITIAVQNYSWLTPALEISYGLVYSIAPFCILILVIQTLVKIYSITKSLLRFSQKSKRGE